MVFNKLRQLIMEQFAVDADAVTLDTAFADDLNADSLDIVELTMAIEAEFDLHEISEDELSGLQTVDDVVKYLSERVDD